MAIDFPNSPTVGQNFTSGNTIWVWDGTKWMAATGTPSGLGYTGFRNKLFNGAMRVDQRNCAGGGAAFTGIVGSVYGVDRWTIVCSQAGKISIATYAGGIANMPQGFSNSVYAGVQVAYTPLAGDYFLLVQYIEGVTIGDLGWGTANAQPVTLSFWFQSILSGTFSGSLNNGDGSRSYAFSWSYPTVSVWQKVTITIPGDTAGTWKTDSTAALALCFSCGCGSNHLGTAGAWTATATATALYGTTGSVGIVNTVNTTFIITGAQLEAGSVATPFEFRPYGLELELCQRYYELGFFMIGGYAINTATAWGSAQYSTTKRSTPTMTYSGLAYNGLFGSANFALSPYGTQGLYTCVGTATGSSGWSAQFVWYANAEL